MSDEKIIEEFFRSLRAALTNSFSYSKNHPYFTKSVENFKVKLEQLLAVINPFKFGVTNFAIVVGNKNLTKAGLYDDLAKLLHRRKIKSIEIRTGATLNELVSFFSVISMPQEEIIKIGGVNAILEKQPLFNFTIEELDYSVLLHDDGQECTDVWSYMLKEAVQSNDEEKINSFADRFSTLIKGTSQNAILEAQEMPAMINGFLVSLRKKDKEKFARCSKDIFLWLLHNKQSINEERLVKLKQIFDSLNQEDLSALLWEGLSQDDHFDALSLQFFSKITEQKKPVEIARGVFNKVNASQSLSSNPRVVKKIQDLLVSTKDDNLSIVYRNTLESLVKGISFAGALLFDQKSLKENYRYIVLNMLTIDNEKDLLSAAEVLERELPNIVEDNDLGFLKDLRSLLIKRKKEGVAVCIDLELKFSAFIENIILSGYLKTEQEYLLELVSFPSQEVGFYLHQIFSAEVTNQYILSLFLKLFPGNLDIFYQRVELRLKDIEFISSLVEALGQIKSSATMGILDHIYDSANELIKFRILNTMLKLKKGDPEFLVRQLNTDSPVLRKQLFSVLMLDPRVGDGVLDLLLKLPSFFGSRNELLIENMQIVFDLGLIESAGRIYDLSRKRFFWNQKLRAKAQQILKEWNAH
jgi:hypothetical protein